MKSGWKRRMLTLALCASLVMSNGSITTATDMDSVHAASVSSGDIVPEQDVPAETQNPEETEKGPESTNTTNQEPAGSEPGAAQGEPSADADTSVSSGDIVSGGDLFPEFKGEYADDQVYIHVYAPVGVLPKGVELKVAPIVQQAVTEDMSAEAKAAAEEANAEYAETERLLQEDAAEAETELQGFLAYNISFLVTDEETGEVKEIEPNAMVQVAMEFRAPQLPEGVTEDANVSVKHLEEHNENNAVEVLDVPSASIETEADTVKVQSVAFASDCFSTYSITWEAERATGSNVTLKYVYINGRGDEVEIPGEEPITISNNRATVDRPFRVVDHDKTIEGYQYSEAYIYTSTYSWEHGWQEVKTPVTEVWYKNFGRNRGWYYKSGANDDGQQWDELSYNTIYLSYKKVTSLGTIPTADTKDKITLNLFDYEVNGINANHILQFSSGIDGTRWQPNDTPWNKWFEDKRYIAHKGIVKNRLVKNSEGFSFPVLNPDNTGGGTENLEYLFNPAMSEVNGRNAVREGVNHLFTYDSQTGYYSYDSADYFAEYCENPKQKPDGTYSEANSFIVYDAPATHYNAGKDDKASFKKGNFFPFDDLNKDAPIAPVRDKENLRVLSDGKGDVNYSFGMTMELNFFQPQNGMMSGNPMVFEFSGDDDVWVFIDDVLILDIGGIHDEVSGSINFKTGDVKVGTKDAEGFITENLSTDTNLKALFDEASTEEEKADADYARKFAEDTFANDTMHTLKFFYLERGGGASNCQLKFNMPPVPKGNIYVQKEISNINEGAYSDVEFEFELYVEGKKQTDKAYTVKDVKTGDVVRQGNLEDDENGRFKLKHGQRAEFTDYEKGQKFYVREVGLQQDEYDRVEVETFNGHSSTGKPDVIEDVQNGVTSKDFTVGEDVIVVFSNRCHGSNLQELYIEKAMADGSEPEQTFTFDVTVGEKPFKGKYTVAGTEHTAVDGQISLQAGQEAIIDDLPGGTSFEVVENTESLEGYATPEYSFADIWEPANPVTNGKAAGTIKKENNAKAVITNRQKGLEEILQVAKDAEVNDWDERTYDITLTANSLKTETTPGQDASKASIVIVLDYSKSMDGRIDDMEEAVKNFIGNKKALGSQIGIVKFSDRIDAKELVTLSSPEDVQKLQDFVDKYFKTNYTHTGDGMEKAQEILQGAEHAKHVILFTDGNPNASGWNASYNQATLAYETAEAMKQDVTIHTIGLGIDDNVKVKFEKDNKTQYLGVGCESYLKDYISSTSDNYHSIDDIGDLEGIFGEIIESITEAKPIENATVTDVIDSRFELTKKSYDELIADKAEIKENEDGTTTITWENQTIDPKDENGEPVWDKTITVRAKDNFLGGNMIPTNGPGSGVTVDGKTLPFEKPTVNVKLLNLSVDAEEKTLFVGENITPAEYIQWLVDNAQVIGVNGSAADVSLALIDAQVAGLIKSSNGTLEVPYNYTEAGNLKEGTLTYTVIAHTKLGNAYVAGTMADHTAKTIGDAVEYYTLQITYNAKSIAERQVALDGAYEAPETGKDAESFDGEEVTVVSSKVSKVEDTDQCGTYIINVVKGSIQIEKRIKKDEINFEHGDPIFTFEIRGEKEGNIYYRTVRFDEKQIAELPENEGYITLEADLLDNLTSDTYTVKELTTLRYEIDKAEAEGLEKYPADVEVNGDKTVRVIIGSNGNGKRDTDARDAKVTFTNKKVTDDFDSDTGLLVNKAEVDENGSLSFEQPLEEKNQ